MSVQTDLTRNSRISPEVKLDIVEAIAGLRAHEVLSEIVDRSAYYAEMSLEQQVRHLLNDRIMKSVWNALLARNNGAEMTAFQNFVHNSVLVSHQKKSREWEDFPPERDDA